MCNPSFFITLLSPCVVINYPRLASARKRKGRKRGERILGWEEGKSAQRKKLERKEEEEEEEQEEKGVEAERRRGNDPASLRYSPPPSLLIYTLSLLHFRLEGGGRERKEGRME